MTSKEMVIGVGLVTLFVLLLSLIHTDTSYANDLIFEHIMYTSTEAICNENFIGTDWDTSMKYEGICEEVWAEKTRQIISAFNL